MDIETVTVYQHKRSGRYVVDRYVGHRGASYGVERIVVEPQSQHTLVSVILDALARHNREQYDFQGAPKYSDQESLRFAKEHRAVGVTRYSDGRIVVRRLVREGPTFVGWREDSVELGPGASEKDFLDAVLNALAN